MVVVVPCRTHNTGPQTNNFAEASIRILKDIVLSRTKAFNTVALAESVGEIMEKYFKGRIIKHANNRVPAHHLLYDRLLKRMPEKAAAGIGVLGDGCFSVPSSKNNGESYDVCGHTGTCKCQAGNSGAFCKHQALVHKHYGGLFPNCPALTAEDRHLLGWLALGDDCPSVEYFSGSGDAVSSHQDFPPELQPGKPMASPRQVEQPGEEAMHDVLPSTSGLQQQEQKVRAILQTSFNSADTLKTIP